MYQLMILILPYANEWYVYYNVPVNVIHTAMYQLMIVILPCSNEWYVYYHVPVNDIHTAMYQLMILILPCTNEWYWYCRVPCMILVLIVKNTFKNWMNDDASKFSRYGVSCTPQTMLNKLRMEGNYNLKTRRVMNDVCGFHTVCHIMRVLVFQQTCWDMWKL